MKRLLFICVFLVALFLAAPAHAVFFDIYPQPGDDVAGIPVVQVSADRDATPEPLRPSGDAAEGAHSEDQDDGVEDAQDEEIEDADDDDDGDENDDGGAGAPPCVPPCGGV